jgi:hypothetical protein
MKVTTTMKPKRIANRISETRSRNKETMSKQMIEETIEEMR